MQITFSFVEDTQLAYNPILINFSISKCYVCRWVSEIIITFVMDFKTTSHQTFAMSLIEEL